MKNKRYRNKHLKTYNKKYKFLDVYYSWEPNYNNYFKDLYLKYLRQSFGEDFAFAMAENAVALIDDYNGFPPIEWAEKVTFHELMIREKIKKGIYPRGYSYINNIDDPIIRWDESDHLIQKIARSKAGNWDHYGHLEKSEYRWCD